MSYDDAPTKNERPRRDSTGGHAPVAASPSLIEVLERQTNVLMANEAIQRKILERLSEPQRISVAPPPPERRGALYYASIALAALLGTAVALVACR